ncbi:hypothetical protein JNM87_00380 [Candidatus Saccharibacteria bacterium]|nr:hypothetical protein [Candidatus Saccharibacteria bacterium]
MKKRRQTACAVLGAVLLLCAVQCFMPTHTSAKTLRLTQKIHAESCTPTTIIDSGGGLQYILPPGCGRPVFPGSGNKDKNWSGRTNTSSPLAVPSEGTITKLFFGGESTYLESALDLQPLDGYMLITSLYSRFSFNLPGDSPGGKARSFQVVRIDKHELDVQFWPGGTTYTLPLGVTKRLDLDYGKEVDISMRFQQINPDGTVLLHVYFSPAENTYGTSEENQYGYIANLILILVLGLSLYVYTNGWYLSRHKLPSDDWWQIHPHQPLENTKK